ncbi:hypothetical protein IAT38_006598 [Cryptococcus sp. DSM 104549]
MRFNPIFIVAIAASFIGCVRGDTEIINFGFPLPALSDAYPPPDTKVYTLSPSQPLTLNVTSSSPERWFALDLGASKSRYKGWTIRASWPASSPTKITLSPPSSPGYFTLLAAPLSPRFPRHPPWLKLLPWNLGSLFAAPPHVAAQRLSDDEFATVLLLTLEPLLLGFLPRTVLPAVGLIVLFATAAWFLVPAVIGFFESAGEWSEAQQKTALPAEKAKDE